MFGNFMYKKLSLLFHPLTFSVFFLHSSLPQTTIASQTTFQQKAIPPQYSLTGKNTTSTLVQPAQQLIMPKQQTPTTQVIPDQKSSFPEKVETKDGLWEKYFDVNDPLSFEAFYSISADNSRTGGLWVLSGTPNGEIFLSVNGQKIWWSRLKVKDEIFEDLFYISASSITKWTIKFSSNALLDTTVDSAKNPLKPSIDIVGTLWGISKANGLCKFTKQSDGSYVWKQVPGQEKAQAVFSAKDGTVFTLTSDGLVFQRNDDDTWTNPLEDTSTKTTKPSSTSSGQTDLDMGGDPFATDTTGTGTSSSSMSIQMLGVQDKDNVWAKTDANEIYKLETGSDGKKTWVKKNDGWPPQKKNFLTQFTAGQSGVWGVANNTAFRMNANGDWIDAGCWFVQQITSGTKIYCATAEPYSMAIMKNQEGLTAAQQGAIAGATVGSVYTASILMSGPGLILAPLLMPIAVIQGTVAGILAGVLTRPARHEVWIWKVKPGPQETPKPSALNIQSGSTWAIKLRNGNYWSTGDEGPDWITAGPKNANVKKMSYQIFINTDKTISFKALSNDKFVSAMPKNSTGNAWTFIAKASNIGPNEKFILVKISRNLWILYSVGIKGFVTNPVGGHIRSHTLQDPLTEAPWEDAVFMYFVRMTETGPEDVEIVEEEEAIEGDEEGTEASNITTEELSLDTATQEDTTLTIPTPTQPTAKTISPIKQAVPPTLIKPAQQKAAVQPMTFQPQTAGPATETTTDITGDEQATPENWAVQEVVEESTPTEETGVLSADDTATPMMTPTIVTRPKAAIQPTFVQPKKAVPAFITPQRTAITPTQQKAATIPPVFQQDLTTPEEDSEQATPENWAVQEVVEEAPAEDTGAFSADDTTAITG